MDDTTYRRHEELAVCRKAGERPGDYIILYHDDLPVHLLEREEGGRVEMARLGRSYYKVMGTVARYILID